MPDVELIGFEIDKETGAHPERNQWCVGWMCPTCLKKNRVVFALAFAQGQSGKEHQEWLLVEIERQHHEATSGLCTATRVRRSRPYLARFSGYQAWKAAGSPDRPELADGTFAGR